MLTTLRIKNLALVADLTLELQPGCNVITGETGAGKSIIIGALNLVLGERADQAGHPVPQVRGVSDPGHHAGTGPLDLLDVLAGDRADQVGLGAEVVTDGSVVALPGRLADLAVGDRVHPAFGEQPLRCARSASRVVLTCSDLLILPIVMSSLPRDVAHLRSPQVPDRQDDRGRALSVVVDGLVGGEQPGR